MSVSFRWREVSPDEGRTFGAGTSNDIAALESVFGGKVCTDDISTLRAMHAATRLERSLWSEIADTLERLRGDDFEHKVELAIWTQF